MDGSIKVLLFKRKGLYGDRLNENQSASFNVQNIGWGSAGTWLIPVMKESLAYQAASSFRMKESQRFIGHTWYLLPEDLSYKTSFGNKIAIV